MQTNYICDYCKNEIVGRDYSFVYSLGIETDRGKQFIGLITLLDGLADWLMDKRVHLSASQVVLLRPDILKNYLIFILGEEVLLEFALIQFAICETCLEEYKVSVPLI